MKVFKVIQSLSKNKATVGDKFMIEAYERTVTKITSTYVTLDNGKFYPRRMFNHWMRIAKVVETRDEQSNNKNLASRHREIESMIMRKEAKAIYDEKYRTPAINRMGNDTVLRKYIVLTGVGTTIKFYFSPTDKADAEDMELSYKSLHGTAYSAFAWGYYIQHRSEIALLGMNSYKERNLSEKRQAFALECLSKETIDNTRVNVRLYDDMFNMFNVHDKERKLLSSPQESPKPTEQKHWSGLNGEIAQDICDQGLDQMIEDDGFPF